MELTNERNGLMFALSLRLGLRPGEAAALYWDAIEDGGVNVTRGIRRVGNRVEVSEEVKTSGSRRRNELPDDLIEWFAEHRRTQVAEQLAATIWGDERLVFATTVGTVIEPRNSRQHLADICDRIGCYVVDTMANVSGTNDRARGRSGTRRASPSASSNGSGACRRRTNFAITAPRC